MRKGFTLVELMVIIVIIGMLAAVAVPKFRKAAAKKAEIKRTELHQSAVYGTNDVKKYYTATVYSENGSVIKTFTIRVPKSTIIEPNN